MALTASTGLDFDLEFLVIGGGGSAPSRVANSTIHSDASGTFTGGGGAGGYISSVSGENSGGGASAISPAALTAEIGGGSTTSVTVGAAGSNSSLSKSAPGAFTHTALAGGSGFSDSGGSGSGGNFFPATSGGAGTNGQGYSGSAGAGPYTICVTNSWRCEDWCNPTHLGAGGGAGQGGVGINGGNGVQSSITGTATYYAAGGGSTETCSTRTQGTAGLGAGNYGSAGGRNSSPQPGAVILRYPNTVTISNPGGGLTLSTSTVGSNKVTVITAGTGNVAFEPA